MALNNDKQDNLKKALLFLQEYKNKPELGDNDNNKITGVEMRVQNARETFMDDLKKESDGAILREIANEFFSVAENHPKLMRELKEKYFK